MQYLGVLDDQFSKLIGLVARLVGMVDEGLDIRFGKTKYLSQFPQHRVVLKSAVGTQKGHMFIVFAVIFSENIIRHLVTICPAEIDVKVRGDFLGRD